MSDTFLIWLLCGLTILGVITRPRNTPEAVWSSLGALATVLFGLLSPSQAWQAALKGLDVYLFLIGMMLLSELARVHGLFDWLAHWSVNRSERSASKLFFLLYAIGVLVTVFLSNDATAVVLTPAVLAVARVAEVEPLPYLFSCAFIANAASFVLPISNPANLVLYGSDMPSLAGWLRMFGLPSVVSILLTLVMLYFSQARYLEGELKAVDPSPKLGKQARVVAAGLVLTSITLLVVSALKIPLGLPTCLAALSVFVAVSLLGGSPAATVFKGVSWSVVLLVAGLFVLVEALSQTGVVVSVQDSLQALPSSSSITMLAVVGVSLTVLCNLANNLPVGLLVATVLTGYSAPALKAACLVSVDLSPNLSVTGSLATILWLQALRREGVRVTFVDFLKLGAWVTPLALAAALAVILL